jgi:hypothetical protein
MDSYDSLSVALESLSIRRHRAPQDPVTHSTIDQDNLPFTTLVPDRSNNISRPWTPKPPLLREHPSPDSISDSEATTTPSPCWRRLRPVRSVDWSTTPSVFRFTERVDAAPWLALLPENLRKAGRGDGEDLWTSFSSPFQVGDEANALERDDEDEDTASVLSGLPSHEKAPFHNEDGGTEKTRRHDSAGENSSTSLVSRRYDEGREIALGRVGRKWSIKSDSPSSPSHSPAVPSDDDSDDDWKPSRGLKKQTIRGWEGV